MANWYRRFTDWLIRHKKRIGIVALGHAAKQVEEIFFDWLVYGSISIWAVTSFGAVQGSFVTFAIMAPVSAIMCSLYLKAYDWSKTDWFGFELLKSAAELQGESWITRVLAWLVRKGDVVAFFVLSINMDPFMTTVYLRKGSEYKRLTRHDRDVFFASVLVSNGYWTFRWAIVDVAGIWLWHHLLRPALQYLGFV